MAKFAPRLDIWALSPEARAKLPRGQYVKAGEALGRFWGQTQRGTDVVAWSGNSKGRGWSYHKALINFAKA